MGYRSRKQSDSLGYGSFSFQQPRKRRNAKRGMVSTVVSAKGDKYSSGLPGSGSRGSGYSYGSTKSIVLKSKLRALLLAILVLALLVGIAVFVGKKVYFSSIDSKMALAEADYSTCLVSPSSNDAYSVLFELDLGEKYVANSSNSRQFAFIYAYVNKVQNTAYLLSFPMNTQISQKGTEVQTFLSAAQSSDYDLISGVAQASGLEINHYVKITEKGIGLFADKLGGITVNVSEQVDDPNAGPDYIPQGQQTLNASSSLTFLRASNFKNGETTQRANQRTYLSALFSQLANQYQGRALTLALDDLSEGVKTDIPAKDIAKYISPLINIPSDKVYSVQIPGYEYTQGSTTVYIMSSSEISKYASAMQQGSVISSTSNASSVDPSSVSVVVKNGSGVDGGAATITNILASKGFKATAGGNTDSYAYSETLVVYIDSAKKDAAQAVAEALGFGRVIDGTGFYAFEGDVQVILGKDWKPAS